MIQFDVILALFLFVYIFGFLLGFLFGRLDAYGKVIKKDVSQNYKPGGIFKDPEIQLGAVQRPTAEMIAKWNEDPKIKATKEAMNETFEADPELQQLKKEREEFLANASKL